MMTDLAMPITMGIMLGGLYALVALGLSIVFGVMRLVNVAHGDLVLLASYLAFSMMTYLGMDPILSLVIGIPILFVLGFAIQKYLLNRAFAISMEAPLIIAFGISIVLQNCYQIIWTPLSRGLNTSYSLKNFAIGDLHLPLAYLLDFIVGVLAMVFLHQFLHRTYLGRAIVAASQDRRAAKLMGINTSQVYAFAFAIAMAFSAIAGVFLGLTFPFTPQSGVAFLIIAFGVVVLGGLGSIIGTFIGGLGLFLLAVSMITDGLKLAAGDALKEILREVTATQDIVAVIPRLMKLRALLVAHFATEEAPDGMTAVMSEHPRYLPKIEEIFGEHEAFLRDVDDILRRAKLHAEGPKAVFRDLALLAERLHDHEARESEILTEATYTDLGGGA